MSDAIKELREYLAKSPSVVYPQDVLEYLPAIEAENAKLRKDAAETALMLGAAWRYCSKLRELVRDIWGWELHGCGACNLMETADCDTDIYSEDCLMREALSDRMCELGIEVTDE